VSACEGIQIADPSFSRGAIVALALAILAGLFLVQQFGTSLMSKLFSPVVTIWLLMNAAIGIVNIARFDASVFKAVSPHYFMRYFIDNGKTGWKSLGGVLLCATGVEALFADLGHFNRLSVQVRAPATVCGPYCRFLLMVSRWKECIVILQSVQRIARY
jgi:KUP system potassium uptake protein